MKKLGINYCWINEFNYLFDMELISGVKREGDNSTKIA